MRKYIATKWMIHTALKYLGKPYIWGGDDPSGYDCSGLVVECLKSAGFLEEHEDFTAEGLLNKYKHLTVESPGRGRLMFTLKENRACHVVLCLDRYYKIGAEGGSSTTRTAYSARRENAYIKIRPIRFDSQKHVVVDLFCEAEP